jgi:hypothetical protein
MLLGSFPRLLLSRLEAREEKESRYLDIYWMSKSKKIKVLTRRPRRIETADVPKLSERVETTP